MHLYRELYVLQICKLANTAAAESAAVKFLPMIRSVQRPASASEPEAMRRTCEGHTAIENSTSELSEQRYSFFLGTGPGLSDRHSDGGGPRYASSPSRPAGREGGPTRVLLI